MTVNVNAIYRSEVRPIAVRIDRYAADLTVDEARDLVDKITDALESLSEATAR